ncbi:unnamed protein product [Camellia sinensis]
MEKINSCEKRNPFSLELRGQAFCTTAADGQDSKDPNQSTADMTVFVSGNSATGAIAGGVAAGATLLFAAPAFGFAWWRRRKPHEHFFDVPGYSRNPQTEAFLQFLELPYILDNNTSESREQTRSPASFVSTGVGSFDHDSDLIEMWDWHGEGYCLQKETNLDISPCLWDGVSQNEEDLSYMFDETTPVKACGDLAYHVADNVNMDKELQQCTEMSSQVKRRRMLQFDNEILGSPLCNEEISSIFLKSKWREKIRLKRLYLICRIRCLVLKETSATGHEGLDQSSEGWLADCFNNDEMHCSPDDLMQLVLIYTLRIQSSALEVSSTSLNEEAINTHNQLKELLKKLLELHSSLQGYQNLKLLSLSRLTSLS